MSIQNNTQYSGEDFYVNVAAGKKKKKSHFRFLEKKMFLTNFCIYIMSQVTIQMNTSTKPIYVLLKQVQQSKSAQFWSKFSRILETT